MSTANEALVWAWRQSMPPSKASAKFLLVAIAGECSRDDGGPFRAAPGHARLSQLTGMNKSTIVRLLGFLVADGFVARERGPVDAQGHRARDVYELPVAVVASTARVAQGAKSNVAKSNVANRHHPKVTNQADLSCTLQQQELKEQNQDLKISPSTKVDAFDEFWSVYPRRVGKIGARNEWGKLKVDPALVIAGAVRYRDDPNRDDEYTAHPSTWLHRGSWDDDPLPTRARPTTTKPRREQAQADYEAETAWMR